MSEQKPKTSGGKKWLACLLVPLFLFGILLVVLVGGYTFFRPEINDLLGIAKQQGEGLPQLDEVVEQGAETQRQLQEQVAGDLPTAIAALPSGELTLSQEQINSYLAANPDQISPLEEALVQFRPGEVQVDVRAFDTESQIISGLAVEDGRIVVTDPQLDGPLGMFLPVEDLVTTLEQQINEQFAAQGRSFQDVRVEEGQVTVVVE